MLQFTTERGHEEISEDIHSQSVVSPRRLKTDKQTDLLQFLTPPYYQLCKLM